MSSIAVSMIVFACVFGGAVCGILLSRSLPSHHLSADSTRNAPRSDPEMSPRLGVFV
jgi:hypothetical protein